MTPAFWKQQQKKKKLDVHWWLVLKLGDVVPCREQE
jgi:hypothetical protein